MKRKTPQGQRRAEKVKRRKARAAKQVGKEQRRKARPRLLPMKPAARKPAKRPSKIVRWAASIALAIMPSLAGKARAGAHPNAPPNPAVFKNVDAHQIVMKYLYHPTERGKSFTMMRYSQKATPGGPVITFDRVMPSKGGPKGIKVGWAQGIKINEETVLGLGFRSPETGKGNAGFGKMDYGLMLSTSGIGAEFHHLGGKDASAFTLSAPVKIGNAKTTVSASYLEPGFFSKGPSKRFAATDLQKVFGINLGNLATTFGMTFPNGKRAKFDVTIFKPIKKSKIGPAGLRKAWWRCGGGLYTSETVLIA